MILGYHAHINPERLGLTMMVLIEVIVKRSEYPRFQKAVQKLSWVLECHHVTGRACFCSKQRCRM